MDFKCLFKVSVNTVELKRAELNSSSNIKNDSSHLGDQSQSTCSSYTPIINHAYILRKTIEGYLDPFPSLTFNTIKT